jgi:UDP-N-acetylmuramoyl-L-alanyl-D-glutamate--2,6-diaminopimelate ligase
VIKTISELIKDTELTLLRGNPNILINSIYSDSRKTNSESIFCLYSTSPDKANEYLLDAFNRGCRVFLVEKKFSNLLNENCSLLISDIDPIQIHGFLCSALFDHPSLYLDVVGVTGTNGKTTTTSILYQYFQSKGISSGLIGTISAKFSNQTIETGYTTPEPFVLQSLLNQMKNTGVQIVFIETSSHGLKLGRLNGVHFKAGIFTNLTPDHRDFHPTLEDYFQSKLLLFKLLKNSKKSNKIAIISKDSIGGTEMWDSVQNLKPDFLTVALGSKEKHFIQCPNLSLSQTTFELISNEILYKIKTKLLGDFNTINLSLAILFILNFSKEPKEVLETRIERIEPIEGRFHLIYSLDKKRVGIVDYAHTPDALENILKTIRKIPNNKVITVFGCGGDRDKKKRPEMGKISSELSDFTIITSDNPRTEDPEGIILDILNGIDRNNSNWISITDRKKAIQKGVSLLPDNGILLIAGKGHENYQILGNTKYPFSDWEELKKAFEENNPPELY